MYVDASGITKEAVKMLYFQALESMFLLVCLWGSGEPSWSHHSCSSTVHQNVSTWSNRKPSKVPNPDNVNLQRRLVNVGTSSNCKPYKPDSLNWCQLNIPAGGVEIKLCSILMNLWFENLFPSLSTVSFSCEGPGPGGAESGVTKNHFPKLKNQYIYMKLDFRVYCAGNVDWPFQHLNTMKKSFVVGRGYIIHCYSSSARGCNCFASKQVLMLLSGFS
jgi:hypothetical protein